MIRGGSITIKNESRLRFHHHFGLILDDQVLNLNKITLLFRLTTKPFRKLRILSNRPASNLDVEDAGVVHLEAAGLVGLVLRGVPGEGAPRVRHPLLRVERFV